MFVGHEKHLLLSSELSCEEACTVYGGMVNDTGGILLPLAWTSLTSSGWRGTSSDSCLVFDA